jgi:predicted ArsR family transcriptional regulator
MNKEYTAATFAKVLGVEKEPAYGLLRFLVAAGHAESLGSKRAEGKTTGRGENHYRIKESAPDAVAKLIKAAL